MGKIYKIYSRNNAFFISAFLLIEAFCLSPFFCIASSSIKDTSEFYVIQEILIKGNKKTKDRIILRELDIQVEDTLFKEGLDKNLLRNRNKIFNTNLFVTVELAIMPDSTQLSQANLLITVKEMWYTFPVVIFELADRNFNEWWHDRNADLRRTNYGVQFVQKNMRGRNETLNLLFQLGFTRRYEFSYQFPYINAKQTLGLQVGASFSENNDVAYATQNNKLAYLSEERKLRERTNAGFRLSYRPKYYTSHSWELKFYNHKVDKAVVDLNPNYYLQNQTQQKYFKLAYTWDFDRRDVRIYPLKGYRTTFYVERAGLGILDNINITASTLSMSIYKPIQKDLFVDITWEGKLSWPPRQPYANIQGLGYGTDYVRGYEFYVIDGQNYFLHQSSLKWRLFDIQKTFNFIPIPQFRTIPLALYPKVYFDAGFVHNQFAVLNQNSLANQWLMGGGIGFDLVTFYNAVFKFEYSINKQLERGFYFSYRGKF